MCKRREELLWEWKETAASPFLWLWEQVGADLPWHHEKSDWVSVAEMPFVDALPCWTLWPPALRTPNDMVIHRCKGTQVRLPPLAVPAPHAARSPSGTLSSSLPFGAGLFVQPGLGNSGAEGHSFSIYPVRRGMWSSSPNKLSCIKGLCSRPSSCLILEWQRNASFCLELDVVGVCTQRAKEYAKGVTSYSL